eukprot:Clim_evm3s179 gene=Clim_evmTU3s179
MHLLDIMISALMATTLVRAAPSQVDEDHTLVKRGLDWDDYAWQFNGFGPCPADDHFVFDEWVGNDTFWKGILPDHDFNMLNWGYIDITPLYEAVAELSTDFEEYIEANLGSFKRHDEDGNLDVWNSYITKLNTVTAPVLMSPFAVEVTGENYDKWKRWWDALHELLPPFSKDYLCRGDANDMQFKPKKLSFLIGTDPDEIMYNEYYSRQEPTIIDTKAWLAYTKNKISSPNTMISTNNAAQCAQATFSYVEEITESTEASSTEEYNKSVTASTSVEVSASVEGSFAGIGGSASTTITAGLEATAGKSTQTSESVSYGYTTTTTYDISPIVRPDSVLNVTMWVDQYEADIIFTGDANYDDEYSGVTMHIDGYQRQGNWWRDGPTPFLNGIASGHMVTPKQIREVVRLAMDVIGAKWSEAFVHTMTAVSFEGRAHSVAGDNVHMEVNECNIHRVPPNQCSPSLADAHPPTTVCDNMALASESGLSFALDNVPEDCYQFDPIKNHRNRYVINMKDECKQYVVTGVTQL